MPPSPLAADSESMSGSSSLSNRLILFAITSADTDRTNNLATALQQYTTSKDHDSSPVGGMNAEERTPGLSISDG